MDFRHSSADTLEAPKIDLKITKPVTQNRFASAVFVDEYDRWGRHRCAYCFLWLWKPSLEVIFFSTFFAQAWEGST